MRSFIYSNQTTSDAIKVIGNVQIEFTYTGATSLVCYAQSGVTPSNMAEITDADGSQVTRFTATGSGTEIVNISGLTPGSYIGINTESGTGTVTATILTGGSY